MRSTRTVDAAGIAAATESAVESATTGSSRVPGVVAGVTSENALLSLSAAGVRAVDGPDSNTTDSMTTDTVFALFSTTKAITATVALQLVEDGRLDLDAPAAEYAPRLRRVSVIEGFDHAGNPQLRAPSTPITTRQLLTHTAGFGYDFFTETYRRLTRDHGVPGVISATRESLATPLLFDPGTAWEYGSNVDWAGLVVEGITGQRLGDVMSERVFSPLGMSDTSFTPTRDTAGRRAVMHHRTADGGLRPNRKWAMPAEPELHMGGQGLYSTVRDYLAFIRMWLNDGLSDTGDQLLRPETIADAERNHIGDLRVHRLPGVLPAVTQDAEFFPGVSKTWGLTSMRLEEPAPTGRPAGTLGWGGLANLYYWIDRRNRIGGFWAAQLFPFFDPTAIAAYLDFESSVYDLTEA
ncbi:serine hydrolase domain-containing protein [Gordonia sp. LSe1-13]|uniref:Serine hydrolase domain-containing protein n=1 Tax=Gordonia sesuvii TaxID=3116777 RepID=A0ABU7MCR3_9ACTN|nr:serine hydrolase domain-containing protein [Gordonia sp. LSe1-13]